LPIETPVHLFPIPLLGPRTAKVWPLLLWAAVLAFPPKAIAADGVDGVTAVASKVSGDYKRAKLPDGSFQIETYAFGSGGNWGGDIKDATIDKLNFLDVAKVIAGPLASQKYLPAKDPNNTKLLIMVYWGTTTVPPKVQDDVMYGEYNAALAESRILMAQIPPQVDEANAVLTSALHTLAIANHIRDELDFKNAAMIGYSASGLIGTDEGLYLKQTALGIDQRDEVNEIEQNRYFVVLMAYDFQLLWKEKKHKLLWETRFSINELHNAFDKALPVMARFASQYFGEPTSGLVRTRVPEGQVDIGEVRSLGEVKAPAK
jgi:hypothetical protein